MGKVVFSTRKVVTESGAFLITTEQPAILERGHAGRFQAQFEHLHDGLITPTSPALKIYEGETLKATPTLTNDSTGIYFADYTVPATDKVGRQIAEWTGAYSGLSIQVRKGFRVVRTVS
jgi:hypothetical protein